MSEVTTTKITVEHVTITSSRPFDEVEERLHAAVPPVDAGIFVLLRFGEAERALAELEKAPALSIFGARDHGGLLQIAGQHRRAVQFDIGNPLTASKMTRHDISAALYAPIRVLLREDARGVVAFEYDRPASVFGQFANAEVDAAAADLDTRLMEVLRTAAA